jgi:mono/diheme cytochrome c family protein
MTVSRNSPLWALTLVAFVGFGLSACSGEAANGEEAEVEAEQAQAMALPAAEGAEAAAETMAQELPEGVTAEMVEEGTGIYAGAGICSSCHGPAGEGIPNLGADLTDDEWLHSDGGYEGILASVMEGVTAQESSSGVPMPAKAGTNITDEQAAAVAAYVWTLSQ